MACLGVCVLGVFFELPTTFELGLERSGVSRTARFARSRFVLSNFSDFLISSNNFFSFLAAMMLAYQPIRSLATLNMVAYQGAAAAKRIFTVIDKPIETKNNEDLPSLKIDKCDIKFTNISFHYVNTKEKAIKKIK